MAGKLLPSLSLKPLWLCTSKQRTEGTIQEEVDVSYERKTVTAETSTQAVWYDIADGRATTDDTIFSTKNKRFLHPHVEKLSKFLLHSCIILLPQSNSKKTLTIPIGYGFNDDESIIFHFWFGQNLPLHLTNFSSFLTRYVLEVICLILRNLWSF